MSTFTITVDLDDLTYGRLGILADAGGRSMGEEARRVIERSFEIANLRTVLRQEWARRDAEEAKKATEEKRQEALKAKRQSYAVKESARRELRRAERSARFVQEVLPASEAQRKTEGAQ